jgi:hypothetical protein
MRSQKIALLAGLLLIAAVTMGADSCSTSAIETSTSPTQTTAEGAPTEEEESGETNATPPPTAKAPKPVVIRGQGKVVKSLRLATNTPVVVTAHHTGQSNFIVDFVGHGAHEYLFNEIGNYDGQAAIEDRAGVPWAGFHTFRHTCATTLFRRGLNAKQVQVWLGHHSPAFTLATYVHFLADDLPDAAFLDDVTGPGATPAATSPTETLFRPGGDEEGESALLAGETPRLASVGRGLVPSF